jgi:SAM-dependent methyltransferase
VFAAWNPSQPEISDLIIQHDPVTLERLPVRKDDVRAVFARLGNRQAVKVVDALPDRAGVLDAEAIDRLFVVVHSEMQRLAEEFYHGGRVWELLQAAIAAIRSAGRATGAASSERLRVVDIGCGIGYTVRWLAARTPLAAQGVELVGLDLNSALIREASRLARKEKLPCRFVHGDAFSPANAANIYLSTGVLHHFRGDDLGHFFRRHELAETQAFLYYDFQPSFLAAPGSWFFHVVRMRTGLARHDGVLSAVRVHSAETLVRTARAASPGFACGMYGRKIWRTPLPRVFHTLVGIRRALIPEFRRALGRRTGRLDDLA